MVNTLNKIKVVQLARIPCANSGYYLSQLINQYSQFFESRYILGSEYSQKYNDIVPFRKFPTDLFWQTEKEQCIEIIKKADIIHIHHGFWGETEEIQNLLKNKKVITTVYDLSLIHNQQYYRRKKAISTLLTVADQPAQKRTFSEWSQAYVPLINCLFDENTEKHNERPVVLFAPTNRYPITNNSSKGYYEVLKIIDELKQENYDFEFVLVEGISHEEDLNAKRKADIIIDDVINQTFHNTALQSACFGAIALTGYSDENYPFIETDLRTLKSKLIYYITNPEALKEEQRKIVQWRKLNYNPYKLLQRYEQLYDKLITTKSVNPELLPIQRKLDIFEFLKIITPKYNICLLKDSCFFVVIKGALNLNELTIAVQSQEILTEIYEIYNESNWNFILKASLAYPSKVKSVKFQEYNLFVPCPVIEYLEKYCGKSWQQITGKNK